MKSLLITSVFPPQTGGSGRWFWEIYRRLPREEYVIAAEAHPQALDFDIEHDLNVHRLPLAFPDYGTCSLGGFKRYRHAALQVRKLIDIENVEAVHCGALLPDGWIGGIVARKRRLPLLVYLHGEEVCYTDSSRELNWMARRVLNQATRIVVNSHNTARIARDHWRIPVEKVQVLHPGVDCQRFVPAERNLDVRRRLGWDGRPVILTVGRLQKRKGHDMLLRALPAIRERVPDVLYAIVGDGQERGALERLVEELGLQHCVVFHGEPADDQLVECYQQCDLFALPNRQIGADIEGFGIVLLEAQACGNAVLAGDSGGTRETMQIGHTGKIVDCCQTQSLADAASNLLTDESFRSRLVTDGHAWVAERFDWGPLSRQAREYFSRIESTGRSGLLQTNAFGQTPPTSEES